MIIRLLMLALLGVAFASAPANEVEPLWTGDFVMVPVNQPQWYFPGEGADKNKTEWWNQASSGYITANTVCADIALPDECYRGANVHVRLVWRVAVAVTGQGQFELWEARIDKYAPPVYVWLKSKTLAG